MVKGSVYVVSKSDGSEISPVRGLRDNYVSLWSVVSWLCSSLRGQRKTQSVYIYIYPEMNKDMEFLFLYVNRSLNFLSPLSFFRIFMLHSFVARAITPLSGKYLLKEAARALRISHECGQLLANSGLIHIQICLDGKELIGLRV